MSGGHFNYDQYRITGIKESIEETIRDYEEGKKNTDLSSYTIDKFRQAVRILNEAYVYAQRIDWLLSCDDGEDSFHRRLEEDLAKLD